MKQHKLTIDIYADWDETPPRYRVFVDGDLLTERDFIYDSSQYIREHMIVNLKPGEHTLHIEQCNTHGVITAKNPTLNGNATSMEFST